MLNIYPPLSLCKIFQFEYFHKMKPSLGWLVVFSPQFCLLHFVLFYTEDTRNPTARLDRILSRKFLYSEREDIS